MILYFRYDDSFISAHAYVQMYILVVLYRYIIILYSFHVVPIANLYQYILVLLFCYSMFMNISLLIYCFLPSQTLLCYLVTISLCYVIKPFLVYS